MNAKGSVGDISSRAVGGSPQLTAAERLGALRQVMAAAAIPALLVPRFDEHLGEDVAANAERLAWLTGFTGSAGIAAVTADAAAIFVDGRYTLQADAQVDDPLWQRRHILQTPPQNWLVTEVGEGGRVGYDPWLVSADGLRPYLVAGLEMVPLATNLVDSIWIDRPDPPAGKVALHPLKFSGKSSVDKRSEIAETLQQNREDAAIVSDPASLAWLLNVRGADMHFTPFAQGFVIVHSNSSADVFTDCPEKFPHEIRVALGNQVAIHERAALPAAIADLSGRRVRFDGRGSPAWFGQALEKAGATVVSGIDPCLVPKSRKNAAEQEGARQAHIRDGAALCKFLHFMSIEGPAGRQDEQSAAAQLVKFRAEAAEFRGESFPAISSVAEHAAINHYRVTPASNRTIHADEIYLVDSGAQYFDGTTDVTRTIWTGTSAPPDYIRDQYTRVLKGLIAVDRLIFPAGSAGVHIDGFARQFLWEAGLDYDHGTGHGVGSYLAVHEGPASISRPLRPDVLASGMLMSIEPGYYVSGKYGIRLENLAFVQEANLGGAAAAFLKFENITFVPFARPLVDAAMLSAAEIGWLNLYHAQVERLIGPQLQGAARGWLSQACTPVALKQ